MRRAGYLRIETEDGHAEAEFDTFTCRHCSKVCKVIAGQPVNYDFCRSCMAPICPKCAGKGCDHFEKKLARQEARGRLFRDMGLAT